MMCIQKMHTGQLLQHYLKDEQFSNAELPIDLTESGIVIFCNDIQPSKDEFPIDSTDIGITIFLNNRHFLNAKSLILFHVSGINTSLIFRTEKLDIREKHSEKAPTPKLSTDEGIKTCFNE